MSHILSNIQIAQNTRHKSMSHLYYASASCGNGGWIELAPRSLWNLTEYAALLANCAKIRQGVLLMNQESNSGAREASDRRAQAAEGRRRRGRRLLERLKKKQMDAKRVRMRKKKQPGGVSWKTADAFCTGFLKILPSFAELGLISSAGGRSRSRRRMDPRKALEGICCALRTGIQWKALPKTFGSASSIHKYFQEWRLAGVFQAFWESGLLERDAAVGIGWKWLSADGGMNKARLGGEPAGPNPTDRARLGAKRSILADEAGVPIASVISGANVRDSKLLDAAFEGAVVDPPMEAEINVCPDKACAGEECRESALSHGFVPHVAPRGEGKKDLVDIPGYKARRRVVERVFSWINNFRKILVRYEKKSDNYKGLLDLACAAAACGQVGII
jgi:putative transposase